MKQVAPKVIQGWNKMPDKGKMKDFVLFSLSKGIWEGDVITVRKNLHLQTIPDTKGLFNQKGKDRTGINGCKLKPNQFK